MFLILIPLPLSSDNLVVRLCLIEAWWNAILGSLDCCRVAVPSNTPTLRHERVVDMPIPIFRPLSHSRSRFVLSVGFGIKFSSTVWDIFRRNRLFGSGNGFYQTATSFAEHDIFTFSRSNHAFPTLSRPRIAFSQLMRMTTSFLLAAISASHQDYSSRLFNVIDLVLSSFYPLLSRVPSTIYCFTIIPRLSLPPPHHAA